MRKFSKRHKTSSILRLSPSVSHSMTTFTRGHVRWNAPIPHSAAYLTEMRSISNATSCGVCGPRSPSFEGRYIYDKVLGKIESPAKKHSGGHCVRRRWNRPPSRATFTSLYDQGKFKTLQQMVPPGGKRKCTTRMCHVSTRCTIRSANKGQLGREHEASTHQAFQSFSRVGDTDMRQHGETRRIRQVKGIEPRQVAFPAELRVTLQFRDE